MGIMGILILIVIIIIAVAVFGSQLSSFVDKSSQDIQTQKEGDFLNPTPSKGVWICDLVIFAKGDVGTDVLFDPSRLSTENAPITIGSDSRSAPEGIQYEWRNCFVKGGASLASLLPAQFFGDLGNRLSLVLVLFDENFNVEIKLVGVSDGRIIDKVTEAGLEEEFGFEFGDLIDVPQAWDTTHLVENIVCQDYKAQLKFTDNSINGMTVGSPYKFNINVPDPVFGVCI